MSAPWMDHPKLIVWFDDLEDAVTTAFALTDSQRGDVKVLRAPRDYTWVMLARDGEARERLRNRLREAQHHLGVPVASDCHVLEECEPFQIEEDTFERDNGFNVVDIDYVEDGSVEDLRRELISDADDYAASDETGWFYAVMDGEYDEHEQ